MKYFLFVFSCVLTTNMVSAQDTLITFQGIVPVDSSIQKNTLFSKALEWIGQTYNSAQRVIEVQDKEAGTIILKPGFKYLQPVPLAKFEAFMHYTATLSFKDGKFRYVITDFIPESANTRYPAMTSGEQPNKQFTNAFGKKGWKKTQASIHENIEPLIQSFIAHMKQSSKNENW